LLPNRIALLGDSGGRRRQGSLQYTSTTVQLSIKIIAGTRSRFGNAPLLVRLFEALRRRICFLLGHAIPFQYTPSSRPYNLKIGHLVIDYIENTDGKMLSTSWEEQRHDECRKGSKTSTGCIRVEVESFRFRLREVS
jgi:hypothetical protein